MVRQHLGLGIVAALLSVPTLVACDVADDPGADFDPDMIDQAARSEVDNAQVLNSAVMNGIQMNGIQMNGIQMNGIQMNGIQMNGIQMNGIQMNGSQFTGTVDLGAGPVQKTGPGFIGAEMILTVGTDRYTLRFDDIYENPAQLGKGVWFHDISVRKDGDTAWSSLCTDPAGNQAAAIPMANYWNSTTGARVDAPGVVTFACRGAVLAKCVEWGYIPWASAAGVALKDHHQACTRMARADYCGDGRSYTFNGTPIDVFDKLSPRLNARSTNGLSGWTVEAEWDPNGATCVGDELRMQMYDDRSMSYTLPACLDAVDSLSNCGSFPGSRPASKIANAYCHEWENDPANCAGHNDDPK
jgi:hypothetical protein